jgi:hypothetical protein
VPAKSSSRSSLLRWASIARRSAWPSGRTEPLGRSSSSKGHGRELAIGVPLSAAVSRRPARGLAGHVAP